MADKSGIEWTDATWNPVTGCSKVSQGCKFCYAKHQAWPRLAAMQNTVYTGREFEQVMCHPERLDQPLRWTKPRMIFVNSMSDLFHDDVPFEFIADVFAVMACTTRHTYQVLTKRPSRMLEWFLWAAKSDYGMGPEVVDPTKVWPQWKPCKPGNSGGYDNCGPAWPLENVWLGVSVEDQAAADERIPLLLATPAAVRWISAEPLLGPIDLGELPSHSGIGRYLDSLSNAGCEYADVPGKLDWVVVGGESGPNARPMSPDWARSLRDQCAAAGVPFMMKQWGEWLPMLGQVDGVRVGKKTTTADGWVMGLAGKKAAGRLLDGTQHDGYPGGAA